ncbi:MAG: hypothetical protein R8K49_00205 [Mariprofundaceae bacterium]
MPISVETERNLGTTLGGFLIAVSSICLSIMASYNDGPATYNNEVFGVLGLTSLLTAALMIDSILDKAGCKFEYRLKQLLNGGYCLFCLVLAGISSSIIILYHEQEGTLTMVTWCLAIGSSLAMFFKLMMDDSDHVLFPILLVLYVAAFL